MANLRTCLAVGPLLALTAFSAPSVDGRLNDEAWAKAEWRKGATCEYALACEGDMLYAAIRCRERDPQEVSLAFAPEGTDFNVYRFIFRPGEVRLAEFTSEKGNIRPDPYAPVWKAAYGEEDGRKTIEFALPLSAFYMTRNAAWKTTWLVGDGKDLKPAAGMPPRRAADDVAMVDADFCATGRKEGEIDGVLTVRTYVEEPGAYALNGTEATLAKGWNTVRVPANYPKEGRRNTRLKLVRASTGEAFERDYPVLVDARPIRVRLTKPQYRDNFYPGQDASRVEGSVEVADGSDAVVTLEGPGFPVRTAKVTGGKGTFAFDTKGFQIGDAKLTVRTSAAKPDELVTTVRNLPPSGHRMIWIEDGKLVLNGRKTFRRNIYSPGDRGGKAFAEWYARELPKFHTTEEFSYGPALGLDYLVPELGEKEARNDVRPSPEVFAALEKRVAGAKDTDFGFYYFSDEPECRGISPVYLRHIYERLKELDPYHPALMSSRSPVAYVDCCDWFESHPYINPYNESDGTRTYGRPFNELGRWIDMIGDLKRPDKAIGFLPTCFSYRASDVGNDYPTFAEYDCHVWATLVRGAVSLNPYAYHDLGDRPAICEGTRDVFASVEALEEYLLDGARTTLRRDLDCEAECFAKPDGSRLLAVVNFRSRPLEVDLGALVAQAGATALHEFRGTRTFAAGQGKVTLAPLAVLLATTDRRGADLPTFAQAKERIDALEYERTHRDNQLLEKYTEVTCAFSKPGTEFYKLIDGVRGVWAWCHSWSKCPFVEFSARKGRFAFSKVRVYGTGFYDVRVEVRKDGDWQTVPVRSVQKRKYVSELDLGAVQETVRVRLSFPPPEKMSSLPEVELYEIELPYAGGAAQAGARRTKAAAKTAKELWRLDGTSKGWTKPALVAPRKDGGFVVSGETDIAVERAPGYRWLEVVADDFKVARRGYLSWSIYFWGTLGYQFGAITVPVKGLFTQRLPEAEARQKETLRIFDYNFDIGFRHIRLVDEPENWLLAETPEGKSVIGPGDTIRVALKLADPCEEVSVQFLKDGQTGSGYFGFAVNGSSNVPMRKLDAEGRRWGAEVKIESCGDSNAGAVCLRAVAVGGELDYPIYTQLNKVKFRSKPIAE